MAKINLGKVVPTKGTDYFTNADKTEIQGMVETQIAPTLAEKELLSNKVTSIGDSSTDTEYPSAKATYDLLQAKDALIAELEEQNEIILNQIPTNTATGEAINVNDSSNLPLKDMQVLGNTTQVTTTGKNLLGLEDVASDTFNNVTYSVSNGEIALNGTSNNSGALTIPLKASITTTSGTNYTLSIASAGTLSGGQISIQLRSNGSTIIEKQLNQLPFTFNNLSTTIDSFRIYIASSRTFTNYTLKIQLEQSSTASSYEPYSGGQPSPSPIYPQDIHVVTGDNTIKVVGKNLFDITQRQLGTIDSNGDLSIANSTATFYTMNFKANTSYTISGNYKTSGNVRFMCYYTDNTSENVFSGSTTTYTSFTFTSNSEKTIAEIKMNYSSAGTLYIEKAQLQIEEGSTATTYEPYVEQSVTLPLGDIELAGIPNTDYKDRIFKAEVGNAFYDSLTYEQKATLTLGKWYVYKAIGSLALGDVNYTSATSQTYGTYFRVYTSTYISFLRQRGYGNRYDALCSNYEVVGRGTTTFIDGTVVFDGNSTTVTEVQFKNSNYDDADIFKASMSGQYLYAPITTPTTTEITDTSLINALEQVLAMTTYKTTTNAFTLTVSDNATPTIVAEYRQDIETLINNLDARLSLLE